jgi:hypothetical protein
MKEEKSDIRKNDKATYNYTLAFQTEACMGMIYGATTLEWPDGLSWLVAKALNKKYAPKDKISRVEMKRKLSAVSMSKKEDPHRMFEEFHRLSNLFNNGNMKISDENHMAQVFLAAPDHNQAVLNSESMAGTTYVNRKSSPLSQTCFEYLAVLFSI